MLRVWYHQMVRGQALDEEVGIELLLFLLVVILVLLALFVDLDVGTILGLGTILGRDLGIHIDVGDGGVERVLLNDGVVAVRRVARVRRCRGGGRLLVHVNVAGLRAEGEYQKRKRGKV